MKVFCVFVAFLESVPICRGKQASKWNAYRNIVVESSGVGHKDDDSRGVRSRLIRSVSRNLEGVSPPAALTADLPAAVSSLANPVATAPAAPSQDAPATPPVAPVEACSAFTGCPEGTVLNQLAANTPQVAGQEQATCCIQQALAAQALVTPVDATVAATPPAAPAQACSAFTGCPEGTVLNQLAANIPQVAGQEQATCCIQQAAAAQTLVTAVSATVAPTAVDPGAFATPNATVATLAPAAADENMGFIARHWPSTVAVTCFLIFFFVGYLAMPTAERSKANDNFLGHPCSWLARALGMILFILYLYFSFPVSGYLFGGCFYLSIHGLCTTVTLAGTSLPQWCDVLNIRGVPKMIKHLDVGLKVSTSALGSAATSGFCMTWWLGDPVCSSIFFYLSIWLGIAAMFFGFAWLRGEGGGLMGLMRGRGISGSG